MSLQFGDNQKLDKPLVPAQIDLPKAQQPLRFSGVGDDLDDFLVLSDEAEEVGKEQRERTRPSLVTGVPGEEPPFAGVDSEHDAMPEPIELEPGPFSAKTWAEDFGEALTPK